MFLIWLYNINVEEVNTHLYVYETLICPNNSAICVLSSSAGRVYTRFWLFNAISRPTYTEEECLISQPNLRTITIFNETNIKTIRSYQFVGVYRIPDLVAHTNYTMWMCCAILHIGRSVGRHYLCSLTTRCGLKSEQSADRLCVSAFFGKHLSMTRASSA